MKAVVTNITAKAMIALFACFAIACCMVPTPAFAEEIVPVAVHSSVVPQSKIQTFVTTVTADIESNYEVVKTALAKTHKEDIVADEEATIAPVFQTIAAPKAPETINTPAENTVAEAENNTMVVNAAAPTNATRTIKVNNNYIPYIDSHLTSEAPEHDAGIWFGSDSTTDGKLGYFIGHNPGIFTPVLDLTIGSDVTVWDTDGNAKTYSVVDIFDVPNTTYLEDILPRIGNYGESIALQTCIQGGAFYKVIVAA